MFRALLTLTVLAVPLAYNATSIEAQGRAAQMRFQAMDQNRDGQISRAEWQGNDRSFRVQDWNGDGVLSGPEVRVGARRNINWEEADHNPNRFERNLSWTAGAFTNLDHNRDGKLTPNEWHYDVETFRRVDRNPRDNAISRAEFLGGEDDDDARDTPFDDLDLNNNGLVERTEWYGSNASFTALDRNRDGRLSRFEVVGSQDTTGEVYDQFANLDYDRNGSIARNEWHWSMGSFTARDIDRNGVISRREFESTTGVTPSTTATPSGAGSQRVVVNSKNRWTDSMLDVRAGDVLTFNASGTITMSDNPSDTSVPAGATTGRRAPDAPILNQLAGGLIARIEGYGPIWIGNRTTLTAPVGGRLYLGVNDDHLPDNNGDYIVTVGVQGRTLR
jgi:Ca2+-binding EF-hand superfamily protein